MHSRKLYYFIDSPYIEVADIPNPLTKLTAQSKKESDTKTEKKSEVTASNNKKKQEKLPPRTMKTRNSVKSSENDTLSNKRKNDKNEKKNDTKESSNIVSDNNNNDDDDDDDDDDEDDDDDNNNDGDDDDDDEDNESLIKIKEKIKNSMNSKKHGIENQDTNKSNKHQKIAENTSINTNKPKKENNKDNTIKPEPKSDTTPLKKEIKPESNFTQSFDNKPDELIRQLSSDINDLVGVSLISSKPTELEMELLSDYSSDFSVSTSHIIPTDQDSDEMENMKDIPRPELMSMNELDSLFGDSDLEDINITSEDSKSVDSFPINKKRKFDNISASDSDSSFSTEPKKLNTFGLTNISLLKRNHVKKASGLSHEITSSFTDDDNLSTITSHFLGFSQHFIF